MKILLIHNKYQSKHIGGEDVVFQNEVESLQKILGSENVFLYVVSNDVINKVKLVFQIWFSFSHYKNIKNIVTKNQIDLVHIHNFFPLLTPSIFRAAKDSGAKVIHTLHNYRFWCISGILYRDGFGICEACLCHKFSFAGILNHCYRNSLLQSFVAQLSFWVYRMMNIFEYIDYFFVLTPFQKAKIITFGVDERKIILKPNGIQIALNQENEKQDYIYVGRLEESKGIEKLLEVWDTLDSKFVLTIIGSGNLEENLKRKFEKENIIFKGQCNRSVTLHSIAMSKYLLQPSLLYETFGLTIVEAMGVGVPVIGLNIGTRRDFIQDGYNGFLATIETLREVIEKSYDYTEYKSLSCNAKESVQCYENKYIIHQQITIYENIMEKSI